MTNMDNISQKMNTVALSRQSSFQSSAISTREFSNLSKASPPASPLNIPKSPTLSASKSPTLSACHIDSVSANSLAHKLAMKQAAKHSKRSMMCSSEQSLASLADNGVESSHESKMSLVSVITIGTPHESSCESLDSTDPTQKPAGKFMRQFKAISKKVFSVPNMKFATKKAPKYSFKEDQKHLEDEEKEHDASNKKVLKVDYVGRALGGRRKSAIC